MDSVAKKADHASSKSEATFAAIIDVALKMASIDGIGKLSLGEVAKHAGISKSGVFSRVGSLDALQQCVLDEFDRRFVAEVFKPAMTLPRGLPRLNSIVDRWIERVCNSGSMNACLYVAGSFEFDDVDAPLRKRLKEGVTKSRTTLRRTIKQAIESGHLRPDTDPEQLIFEIYSLIVGAMHDTRFLHDAKTKERMRNAYARLISTYRSFNYQG
jgi:AcrR family transcriptional regulator